MKNRKGFTLIEVLIVVVIIAILASLVLPRFLAQPEKAIIAEGMQVLGALKRAQLTQMDLDNTSKWKAITEATNETQMSAIGMRALPASKFFDYTCDEATSKCQAARKESTATITISANGFTCDDTVYVNDSTSGGCKPA